MSFLKILLMFIFVFLLINVNGSYAQRDSIEKFFDIFGERKNRFEIIGNCKDNYFENCIYIAKNKNQLRKIFSNKKYKALACKPQKLIMGTSSYSKNTKYRLYIKGKAFFTFRDKEYDIEIVPISTYYTKKYIEISFNDYSYPRNITWKLNRKTLVAEDFHYQGKKFNCKLQSPISLLDDLIDDISTHKKKNKL